MHDAALRLFKSLPVNDDSPDGYPSDHLLQEMVKRGVLFSSSIIKEYSEDQLLKILKKNALSPEEINQSFHKCWNTIATADMEKLVLQQTMHYITTYGFMSLGVYNEDTVYIPAEELNIPNKDVDNLPFVVINGLTFAQLKEKTMKLLNTGIALHSDTVSDAVTILSNVGVDADDIAEIENKEAMCMVYDILDIIPKDPQDFMRLMTYRRIGSSLLIKNKDTIEQIKAPVSDNGMPKLDPIAMYFERYIQQHGIKRLCEIFYRFKPLFLAFRAAGGPKTRTIINSIRRKAPQHHKPMPENFLEEITNYIKKGNDIDIHKLQEELRKVTIFRKIRLAYALNYRINGNSNKIMYKIRNGKGFVSEFDFPSNSGQAKTVYNIVLNQIAEELECQVKGRRVYVPWYIDYALPSSEKQFAGYMPNGTCVSVPGPMVFGVHWTDLPTRKVDLDLSWIDASGKVGWNARWRGHDVMYSGDLTAAPLPEGASEFLRIEPNTDKTGLMCLNFFDHDLEELAEGEGAPFDIVVGRNDWHKTEMNCMLDPNDVYAQSRSEIDEKESILGIASSGNDGICRFWFCETQTSKSAVAGRTQTSEDIREYMTSYFSCPISLNEVMEKAGANVFTRKEERDYWFDDEWDIDLSPEKLEKDTLINLFS